MTLNNTAIAGQIGGQLLNQLCYADMACVKLVCVYCIRIRISKLQKIC